MKHRHYFSIIRWSLFIIMIVLLLGPALQPKQARADDYGDLIVQAQAIRQQLSQLLAAYNSMDAKGRAEMDKAMAQGSSQAIQQLYSSLSASDRAYIDAQCRQATGYSLLQLLQSMSTVPGLVKAIDILLSGLGNLSTGNVVSNDDKEEEKEPETKNVTLTLYVHQNTASGPIITGARVTGKDAKGKNFNVITNSKGYVTITGAKGLWSFSASQSEYETNSWSQTINVNATKHAYLILKGLAWQLFPGQNLTNAQARDKLEANIKLRRDLLNKALEDAKQRKANLEKAGLDKNYDAYIKNLESQLEAAQADRVKALNDFFTALRDEARRFLIEFGPDLLNKSTQAYAILHALATGANYGIDAIPAAKILQDLYNKNGPITAAERAQAYQAGIELIQAITVAAAAVSPAHQLALMIGYAGANLAGKLMDLAGTQMEIDNCEANLQKALDTRQYNEIVYQHNLDVYNMKISEYTRELERLNREGGYIDPKYLNIGP